MPHPPAAVVVVRAAACALLLAAVHLAAADDAWHNGRATVRLVCAQRRAALKQTNSPPTHPKQQHQPTQTYAKGRSSSGIVGGSCGVSGAALPPGVFAAALAEGVHDYSGSCG